MPSPIAHVAAGVVVHSVLTRGGGRATGSRRLLAACVALSLLPDADVVPGILLADFARYHNNFAGSPLFGVLVATLIAGAWSSLRRGHARQVFLLALVCYQLHVWMDFFTVSRGVMLAWPLSDARFHPPVHLFYGVRWSDGIVSPRHLITLFTEAVTVAVVFLALRVGRPRLS